jgi:hypothetical protein
MSGVNCGTYPAKSVADAELLVEDQTTEYDILLDDLADLQLAVDAANDVYLENETDSNLANANAVTTYLAKPIDYFFDTTYNTQSITTAEETRVFTNTYPTNTSVNDLSFFFNANANFLIPEIAPINGIIWRAYVNEVIVSQYIQDLGEFVINDTTSRWNIQLFFAIQSGTAVESSYVTARLIANTVMDVGVRYGIRYSCLQHL